jgi:3-hydroxyacyl-CoA dehydrogenase
MNKEGGGRVKEAVDLQTGEYHCSVRANLASLDAAKESGLRALVEHDDHGGRFAWAVLSRTLAYAASLVPEIADDVWSVDRAMQLGYAWNRGPFQLIDELGADYLAKRLEADGAPVPPLLVKAADAGGFYREHEGHLQFLAVDGHYRNVERPEGTLLLADLKRISKPVTRNGAASLWDIGDGVACLEFHTKLNALDPDVLAMMQNSVGIVADRFKALVIYNEGDQFSAGANLGLALFAANTAMWPMIEDIVSQGQNTLAALRAAPFPVVAAPSGLALGGGCEVVLWSDAVQAHARFAADPKRPNGPMPPVATAFETIALAKVATSAFEAKEFGFLRPGDDITFNRERLLADAKARALAMAADYAPAEEAELILPGPAGKAALGLALREFRNKGVATAHDERVATVLAEVLTGGGTADPTETVSAQQVLDLEREGFMRLVRTGPTLARIEHTLETGKPLRN